jgi:hypothetical protein
MKDATRKGLRRPSRNRNRVATPSELRRNKMCILLPGFQSKPWAKISERFQRFLSNRGQVNSHWWHFAARLWRRDESRPAC